MIFEIFLLKNFIKKIKDDHFDRQYYINRYPSIKKFPIKHWKRHGKEEHKICSKKYEEIYLENYRNALIKYLSLHKKKIMFNIFFYYTFLHLDHNFDRDYYYKNNEDIRTRYSFKTCHNHWQRYGAVELRNCSKKYKIYKENIFKIAKDEFNLFLSNKKDISDIINYYLVYKTSLENDIKLLTNQNKILIDSFHKEINKDKLNKIIELLKNNNIKRYNYINKIDIIK